MNFSQQKEFVNRIAVVLMSCWKRCIFFSETTKMQGLLLWNVLVETRFCTLCHLPKSGHTWLGSTGLTAVSTVKAVFQCLHKDVIANALLVLLRVIQTSKRHTQKARTKPQSHICVETFNFATCNITVWMINTAQDQGWARVLLNGEMRTKSLLGTTKAM